MARRKHSESGFTILAVIVAVTLLLIVLAAAAPRMGTQIKRDREEELIHRAHQYDRAIQLFYRKFGRFPNSLDELMNTNNLRFLRRKYKDPITGKDEWRLIRLGQAKPKQLPKWQTAGKGAGGSSGITPAAGLGGSGQSTTVANPNGPPGAVNASDISKPLSGSGSLGVGGIVGVSSTSEKTGLKEIDGKKKYNEWEFVYDPTLDPNLRGGAGAGNSTNPNGAKNNSGPGTPSQPGSPSPSPGNQRPR
jgi:type II secretory pathway pseudopilin PulG